MSDGGDGAARALTPSYPPASGRSPARCLPLRRRGATAASGPTCVWSSGPGPTLREGGWGKREGALAPPAPPPAPRTTATSDTGLRDCHPERGAKDHNSDVPSRRGPAVEGLGGPRRDPSLSLRMTRWRVCDSPALAPLTHPEGALLRPYEVGAGEGRTWRPWHPAGPGWGRRRSARPRSPRSTGAGAPPPSTAHRVDGVGAERVPVRVAPTA